MELAEQLPKIIYSVFTTFFGIDPGAVSRKPLGFCLEILKACLGEGGEPANIARLGCQVIPREHLVRALAPHNKDRENTEKTTLTQPKRVPIATFKNGHTLEPSRKFHAEWELPKLLGGGDNSVWICLRTSEAPRTAVLPVRQPNRELPKTYNPAIGKIKLDPDTCGRSRHRGYSIGDVFKAFNRFTKNTVK